MKTQISVSAHFLELQCNVHPLDGISNKIRSTDCCSIYVGNQFIDNVLFYLAGNFITIYTIGDYCAM